MVLNSLGYLLFLPVVFAGYYLLPGRMRNAFLLAASLAFYGCWELWFMVFLLWAIAVGYLSTVGWLRRSPDVAATGLFQIWQREPLAGAGGHFVLYVPDISLHR